MRVGLFLLLSGCSLGYGVNDAQPDTLCVTAEAHEVCAPATAERVDEAGGVRFTVRAQAQVPGVDFGWEQAQAHIEGVLPSGASLPTTLDALVALVPARVTCVVDEAHGDHCHLGIPYDRACELTLGEIRRVTVDRLDDGGITLRFVGTSTADVPDCCVSTCTETNRPAWTEPSLPYELSGVVMAGWTAPDSPAE